METLCDRLASFKDEVKKMPDADLKKELNRLYHDISYSASGLGECDGSDEEYEKQLFDKYWDISERYNKYLQSKLELVEKEIVRRFGSSE